MKKTNGCKRFVVDRKAEEYLGVSLLLKKAASVQAPFNLLQS
jgi:hypothetical protein